MNNNKTITKILDKSHNEELITRDEAMTLMGIDLLSPEMYALCGTANELSRRHFNNLGEVYAQIGLDFAACPGNCEFCSFGAVHGIVEKDIEYPVENILRAAKICEQQGANGIYLMTTARYPFERFLEIATAVRQAISSELPMVANVADFNEEQARAIAAAGFQAVYHAIRLNEGKGTAFPRQHRIRTIEAARKAGLNIHFCVEPVGPEHTAEELVDLMFLGLDLGAAFSGAMRRVCVPGTGSCDRGSVSWWSLAKTIAVCRLVMGNTVSGHCTHEPNLPAILAGANLLWAEMGPNPRDDRPDTENYRGMSVEACRAILAEADYNIRTGPAITAAKRPGVSR